MVHEKFVPLWQELILGIGMMELYTSHRRKSFDAKRINSRNSEYAYKLDEDLTMDDPRADGT